MLLPERVGGWEGVSAGVRSTSAVGIEAGMLRLVVRGYVGRAKERGR